MQTNGIKQVMHWFNGLKYQNTEFQSFPLYFLKFPLYNVRPLGYGSKLAGNLLLLRKVLMVAHLQFWT